jgi:PncC family amidohydrolase
MDNREKLVKLLIEKGYTISFAESCTGGKMAAAIVDVADASKVLGVSFVTYSNEAKMKYLKVSEETLNKYGAVSLQTAREMAEGVAKEGNADVGVGITGIAGPTGGTTEKPVGTVCFGYCMNGHTEVENISFGNLGRNNVRDASVEHVLNYLLDNL